MFLGALIVCVMKSNFNNNAEMIYEKNLHYLSEQLLWFDKDDYKRAVPYCLKPSDASIWDHQFSTFAKFFEKLTFLSP